MADRVAWTLIDVTYLCVSIFVIDPAQARRDIAAAAEAGADMVELRVDRIDDAAIVRELVETAVVPTIVTCRANWEGGQCELPEAQRVELLASDATQHASYVDLELAAWRKMSEPPRSELTRPVILSSHDFASRPAMLGKLMLEMNEAPAAIAKVAWMARSIRDNLEAFEILQQRQKPTIAICMGEAGMISRILARKFGAFLSFAALEAGGGTASGQISVADMKRLYRWDKIGPRTKVYGVVAQPVMHSMSPAIHNAAFDATGYDGIYVPLLVEGSYESFKAFMETFLHFPGMDLSGLSITIPHKENALRYLREKNAQIEPLAERIGAVNTILIDRDENGATSLRGMNTDYAAILDCITARLGISREQLRGRRVAVIGAGGTGRTAVAGLAHYGAAVTIYNRTFDRAESLAREFDGKTGQVSAAPLESIGQESAEIYINTTSVGMHPKTADSPVGENPAFFSDQTLVFDTIYNPPKTRLLSQAESRGAATIGGIEMFVRQAAAQFEAWTGQEAPKAVMREIVERRLAR